MQDDLYPCTSNVGLIALISTAIALLIVLIVAEITNRTSSPTKIECLTTPGDIHESRFTEL
jgi:hypothetical protein